MLLPLITVIRLKVYNTSIKYEKKSGRKIQMLRFQCIMEFMIAMLQVKSTWRC